MDGIIHFEAFLIAGILLNLTPGNDTLYILSKSMAQGRKAGILSVLGIATGSVLHTTLAALGLSVIIAESRMAFEVIKWAGSAYLIYLGLKMIVSKNKLVPPDQSKDSRHNLFRIYLDAAFTNLLNPKVALFFIAFLPQFIDQNYRHTVIPFLLLGLTFTFTGTVWCLVLALFSSFIGARLKKEKRIASTINLVCGSMLIALGLRVAMSTADDPGNLSNYCRWQRLRAKTMNLIMVFLSTITKPLS